MPLIVLSGLILSGCTALQLGAEPVHSATLDPVKTDGAGIPLRNPLDAELSRDMSTHSPIVGAANSLPGAVASALDYSAGVRGAASSLDLAGVDIDIALSGYMPTLQSSAGLSQKGASDLQVSLSQPLFDWGQTGGRVNQAEANNGAARLELMAAREQAALEAAQAFIAVKRSEALTVAARENLAAHQRISQLARDRAEGGVDDGSAMELAGVHEGEAQATLESELGRLRHAQTVFAARMGYAPERLSAIPELPLVLGDIADVRAAAVQAPAVAAALARVTAAGYAVTAEQSGLLPKLSAEAFARTDGSFNNPTFGVSLQLTSPTLVGLSNFQRIEAADLTADTARWMAEKGVREVVQQVHAYQEQVPTLRNRAAILESQLERAKALRALYEDQFKLGARSVADLVTVLADVHRIDVSLINSRHDIFDLQYVAAGSLGVLQRELAAVASGERL